MFLLKVIFCMKRRGQNRFALYTMAKNSLLTLSKHFRWKSQKSLLNCIYLDRILKLPVLLNSACPKQRCLNHDWIHRCRLDSHSIAHWIAIKLISRQIWFRDRMMECDWIWIWVIYYQSVRICLNSLQMDCVCHGSSNLGVTRRICISYSLVVNSPIHRFTQIHTIHMHLVSWQTQSRFTCRWVQTHSDRFIVYQETTYCSITFNHHMPICILVLGINLLYSMLYECESVSMDSIWFKANIQIAKFWVI